MSYRVEKSEGVFMIIEKDTGERVHKDDDYERCRSFCRSLNLGGGFQGFTPRFFTAEYKYGKPLPRK